MLGDAPAEQFSGSYLPKEKGPQSHLHLLNILKFVLMLEEILLSESILKADDPNNSLHQQNLSGCPLLQDKKRFPSMSGAQRSQPRIVVCEDYWGLNCFIFRDPVHFTFTCLYLDWN